MIEDFGIPQTGTFSFRAVPSAMPLDQRFSWRIPVLLLLLRYIRAGKASFKRLSIATFAMNRDEDQKKLEELLDERRSLDELPTRYEPGLPTLVNFAAARGLISINEGRTYELTDKGKYLADEIKGSGAFETQVKFLAQYGKKLSEAAVNRILSAGIVPRVSE